MKSLISNIGKRELARKLTASIELNKAAQDELRKWIDGFVMMGANLQYVLNASDEDAFMQQREVLNALEESTKAEIKAKVEEMTKILND